MKNMFENRYAECLLLWHTADGSTGKREAVGMALVSAFQKSYRLLRGLWINS